MLRTGTQPGPERGFVGGITVFRMQPGQPGSGFRPDFW